MLAIVIIVTNAFIGDNRTQRIALLVRCGSHTLSPTLSRTTHVQDLHFGLRGLTGEPAALYTKQTPFPRLAPSSAPTRG